jgi:SAM-dependent methyltransferase
VLTCAAVKKSYSQPELDSLLAKSPARVGWDFSHMKTLRQPVPWEYTDVVARYVQPTDEVLDIGTGGGERFTGMAGLFGHGLGIDIDPGMVQVAAQNSLARNVDFVVSTERLEGIATSFHLILNRHAPLLLRAVADHLVPGGYFLTQQVGERNMANVRAALGQPVDDPPIERRDFAASGLSLIAFMEYDVEYVVLDIESLVFWLGALDMLHSDLDGLAGLASVEALNAILAGNVDDRGFVTNEHRYLAIAQAGVGRLP